MAAKGIVFPLCMCVLVRTCVCGVLVVFVFVACMRACVSE